ncbi:PH, RCC1 and FYVE domains-containing protein 1 [Linum perenne]
MMCTALLLQAIFQRYPRPEKEYQSFSLIYGDRSLDLICKDKDEADVWFVGLKALITHGTYNRKWRIDTRSEHSESVYSHTRRSSPSVTPFDLEPIEGQDQSFELEGNPPNRISKAFSDIVSYTASINRPDSSFGSVGYVDNPSGRSSTTETFRVSLSSAVSSSSQGSCHDDFDALGDVFIWGEGSGDGALGGGSGVGNQSTGSKFDALLPKSLESTVVLDVCRIACGSNHAALVTRQGEIFTWGEGLGGRLGHGKEVNVPYPKLVDSLSGMNVDVIACGVYHTCAVTMSGDLYTWGDGAHGSEVSHWIPKRVTRNIDGIHVSNVSCGPWHTAAVTSNGQLFTFGDGTFGMLGHGDRSSTIVPREVESLRGLRTKRVACGLWHTAAVAEEVSEPMNAEIVSFGKLFTWGSGNEGCLGHGDEESKLVPRQVVAVGHENVCQVACGHNFTVVLTASGQVYTMGSADFGQLGYPKAVNRNAPNLVKGKLSDCIVEDVACGSYHVAALTSKSEVYTWGKGSNGQLGHGDKENRSMPKLVDFLRSKQVRNVVCGSNSTAIVCLHKWVGSADHSLCTACRNQFGFRRKRHNCYNCGLVFCKTCSTRKSLKASLAPSTNKPYRVCDDCYYKLKKVLDLRINLPQARTSSCNPIRSLDFADRETLLPRLLSQYSRLSAPDTIRDSWPQSQRHSKRSGFHNNRVFPSVTGNFQSVGWGLLKGPTVTRGGLRNPSPRHSQSSSISMRLSGCLDDTRSMNGWTSSEEIQSLRVQVEDLISRNQRLEAELERKSKQLKQVTSLASDEAEKCRSAKEAIKSLTSQLKEMAERSPREEHGSSSQNSDSSSSKNEQPSPSTSAASHPVSELSREIEPNGNHMLLTYGPKNQFEKPQVVVQAEPGVFITLSSLPAGGNELKRVRFSRKYFSEEEAERWWGEKGAKFCERYNILQTD